MTELYRPFLALVPEGGQILDAGCGSGRDARAFLLRGYRVTAFDASPALVRMASEYLGQPVLQSTFEEMAWRDEFDGIWASATLLHCPGHALASIVDRFIASLRPGGVWYMSFKKGDSERVDEDGRFFCDYTLESLQQLIDRFPAIETVELFEEPSIASGGPHDWVVAIVRRAV